MTYEVSIDGKSHRLQLSYAGGLWQCMLDGREIKIDARLVGPDVLSVLLGGKSYEIKRERTFGEMHLWVRGVRHAVEIRDPRSLRSRRSGADAETGPRKLVASMPGKVVRILVQEKSRVEAGQGIIVVEAMKMQNEIKSPKAGTLQKIVASPGSTVNAGDVLAIVD